jgi:hypothetical protein
MRILILRLASLAGLAVVLCCGWFAMMELLLRHDGYLWRALIAAAIMAQGALTIAVFEDLFDPAFLRWPLTVGAIVTGTLGCWIAVEDLARPGLPARPHFEGYLLIIGLALTGYGLITTAAIVAAASTQGRT